MPAVTISITDHQREFVETEVRSGSYGNVSEVVRDALRLLERQKQEHEAKLRDLRAAIDEGDNSGEPEPLEDIETLLRQARERRAARRQQMNQAS
jgi:antitoxin ParD1/3/4